MEYKSSIFEYYKFFHITIIVIIIMVYGYQKIYSVQVLDLGCRSKKLLQQDQESNGYSSIYKTLTVF